MQTIDYFADTVCPLDNRYKKVVFPITNVFNPVSQYGKEIEIEIKWFVFLYEEVFCIGVLNDAQREELEKIYKNFDKNVFPKLYEIEKTTAHDVKAVEYYIKNAIAGNDKLASLSAYKDLIHFGLTSDDVNNTAYALMIKEVKEVWREKAEEVAQATEKLAKENKDVTILARTHGQPASPTTFGKEMLIFADRIRKILNKFEHDDCFAKFNGSTGNFQAMHFANENVDWPAETKKFVESLGLKYNLVSNQINSYDWQISLYQHVKHVNLILRNFAVDMWLYISNEILTQKHAESEVGSSTMPHKTNPIKFENAEGNLELSNSLLGCFEDSLSSSRLQRDLSDSTIRRNIGLAFAYGFLALDNLQKGIAEVEVNEPKIKKELAEHWEVLCEPVAAYVKYKNLGKCDGTDIYNELKSFARGNNVTEEGIKNFISSLNVDETAKKKLLSLTPESYNGLAGKIVEDCLPDGE